jgi:hypothetical protein
MNYWKYSIWFFSLFLLIVIVSCNNDDDQAKTRDKTKSKNRFSNVIQVQEFGDSLRIEIEKRDSIIIKHHIDLKGKADDGFDNSYNEVCTYRSRLSDPTLKSGFFVSSGGFKFYFDKKKS